MAVVGFDFGTTNSLISLVQGGRVIRFLDDQGLPVPSVVSYEGTKTVVGRDARERLGEAGLGVHGNVVRSPKTLLGQESVFVGGVERSPVDIVADVVRYVRDDALASRTVQGVAIDRAVVTIPVNMEGYRRAELRDAFRMAGVGIVQFIHEPLAALYGYIRSEKDYEATLRKYDRQLLLVFDWGGGTLDLTLCRLVDGMLLQVKNDGTDDIGGDVFDDVLKNEIVRRVIAARGLPEDVPIEPEALVRLRHRCERLKIDLSQRTRAQLFVANFFRGVDDPDLDCSLSRDELEAIVAKQLDEGVGRVGRLLDAAGYTPASVAICLATGGMVNMPIIRARLHELFGPQRVQVSERSATLISEGAAWAAHDDANLHLAKNVELVLARNSYMHLLKAGTEMPREGEVKRDSEPLHLYCADPRDGFAKFQLQSPIRPGPRVLPNDQRVFLESLMVKVDSKAKPFFERLELDVMIDENLVLHAQARSLNTRSHDAAEVHNLEFGLALPKSPGRWAEDNELIDSAEPSATSEKGAIVARANLANRVDHSLVPGELLYDLDPGYFDRRRSPPQMQDDERLYYRPCALCGRGANDPRCRCASKLTWSSSSGGTSPAL